LTLRVNGPFAKVLPSGADNLVVMAAEQLAAMAGVSANVDIGLYKRLPVAAGIGGGSADAAAAIRALCRLWDYQPADDDIDDLALLLGADVPVCLKSTTTHVTGVGETLTAPPTLPPFWLVLVNPYIEVPTVSVFRRRGGAFSNPAPITEPPPDAATLASWLRERRNDLMSAAIEVAPAISDVLAAIEDTDPLLARMTGSGATCFGFYGDETTAKAAATALRVAQPGWWIHAALVAPNTPRS
jgi:4-diphosphocytidyl-2-C-methyl-D-erythritol kinase